MFCLCMWSGRTERAMLYGRWHTGRSFYPRNTHTHTHTCIEWSQASLDKYQNYTLLPEIHFDFWLCCSDTSTPRIFSVGFGSMWYCYLVSMDVYNIQLDGYRSFMPIEHLFCAIRVVAVESDSILKTTPYSVWFLVLLFTIIYNYNMSTSGVG